MTEAGKAPSADEKRVKVDEDRKARTTTWRNLGTERTVRRGSRRCLEEKLEEVAKPPSGAEWPKHWPEKGARDVYIDHVFHPCPLWFALMSAAS
ncbi:hypothetical protein [Tianweitania populi]|uniref:hypothetical protein n=1 Tax=Tianweitania populi TaxID=1607949 RepID=UPI001673ACFC|nr:hypothetical protein [Tianweitania populi]